MKQIIIDGNVLVEDHFSGIGQYSLNIIKSLDQLLNNQKYKENFNVKLLICYDKKNKLNKIKLSNIKISYLPIKLRYYNALFHRNLLPPLDLFFGKGIYIFPKFISSRLINSLSVPIIYDITFEILPKYGENKNVAYLHKNLPKTLKKAYKIITISENSKNDLTKKFLVDKTKIIISYPATDKNLFYPRTKQEITEIRKKYSLPEKYILSISNLEPRKNILSIIKAFCSYVDKYQNQSLSLVIFGSGGWKKEKLMNLINQKIKAGYKIIIPKLLLTDQDKPAVLSGAKILVFIPFYEGFGMPPLEALSCGTPVIIAHNSSLKEITNHSEFFVDEKNLDQIADKINFFLENNVNYKNKLTRGTGLFHQFDWNKSVQNILNNLN